MKKIRFSFDVNGLKNSNRNVSRPLFKKQLLVTGLSVCLVVLFTLTYSYAVFSKVSTGNEYNVVRVGELQLSYVDLSSEGNVLKLANSYPISDSIGLDSSPYRFSVENTGTIIADYTIKIVDDTDTIDVDGCSDNLIDTSYLRYKFDNEDVKSLKDIRDEESGNYIVATGTLKPYESNIHEIRIWIDENSPNSILGTHYHGKVVIDMIQNNTTDPYVRPIKSTIANTLGFDSMVDKTEIDFTKISSDSNGKGIYKYLENNQEIYYFRGNVDNNNVIFGGYCWQIIRTTKSGGAKMIYNGTIENDQCTGVNKVIDTLQYNSLDDDNTYVGYMFGKVNITYDETHGNYESSSVKLVVDEWYKNNLLDYSSYIEDAIYCSDRKIYGSGLGEGFSQTTYALLGRFDNSEKPTLSCSKNDSFTVSSDNGNGSLTYPIGLISGDELVLAGATYQAANNNFYLYLQGISYWTSTPYKFYNNAYVWSLSSDGSIYGDNLVSTVNGIRPVVSLISTAKFTGDGTVSNPYKVLTE